MKVTGIILATFVKLVTIHVVRTININHSARNLIDESSNVGLLIGNTLTNNSSGTKPHVVVPTRNHSTHSTLPFTDNSNITSTGTTADWGQTSVHEVSTKSPLGEENQTLHVQHNSKENANSTNPTSASYSSSIKTPSASSASYSSSIKTLSASSTSYSSSIKTPSASSASYSNSIKTPSASSTVYSSSIKTPSSSVASYSSSIKTPSASAVSSMKKITTLVDKSTLGGQHTTKATVARPDLTTNKNIYERSTENKRAPNSSTYSNTTNRLNLIKLHSTTGTTHRADSTSHLNKLNKPTDDVIVTSRNIETDTSTKHSAESQVTDASSRTPETTIKSQKVNQINESKDTTNYIVTKKISFSTSIEREQSSRNQTESRKTTKAMTQAVTQSMTANTVTNTNNTSMSSSSKAGTSPIVDLKTTNQNSIPTSPTSTEDVEALSKISQSDADKYWPVAMAIAIGVPSIIVIGVTISVINRKRNLEKAHSTLLNGYITPPTEYDV
ncbi:uncharacterized protein LOC125666118 [Ostrea edulis]|uniref:uncharacterized protein LOC125666118 n=1 Tax=Ostrea edulis TaxID=37623 RepID=UPI00209452C4|nr:uncharacterized protein LOC125666118 [Ostrea edulis]